MSSNNSVEQTLTTQIKATIDQLVKDAAIDSYAVFVEDGTILALSDKLDCVTSEETRSLIRLFDDEQDAFTNGIVLNEKLYEVHRWFDKSEPALIYGRTTIDSQNSLDSEGCALSRTRTTHSGIHVYIAIVYKMPTLSAKAVSALVDYTKKVVEPL